MRPARPTSPIVPVTAVIVAGIVTTPVIAIEPHAPGAPATALPVGYVMPAAGAGVDARARWSLPEPLTAYETRGKPMLRFNGRKLKLRVPIG